MATASAITSTSSATAINPTLGVPGRTGHADRRRLRIFPRPPDHRPRRSGRRIAGRSRVTTATFFGDPDDSFAKANVHRRQLRDRASSSADGLTLRNRTLFGRLRQILSEHLSERRSTRPTGLVTLGCLQQHQRPPEPVQPDRPGLGKPARRDRPDCAVRVRARPAEVAQPAADRGIPATAGIAFR